MADGRGALYKPWENLVGRIYLGGEAFCDRMQALVGRRRENRGYPKEQRIFVRPAFESIIELVAEAFDVPVQTLRSRSHHPSRKALAQLAWRDTGLSLAAIGAWMNLTDRAVSHLVRRGEELERRDEVYSDAIRAIRPRLASGEGDESPF